MVSKYTQLETTLRAVLGTRMEACVWAHDEWTIEVSPANYLESLRLLRDAPALRFEQLMDLCGVDYLSYGHGQWQGARYAVVLHLLSQQYNWRVRVRVFLPEVGVDHPLPSVCEVWTSAGWYEREAFDLYGMVFAGHADLRRLLTEYGFSGHPLRKDFPVHGYTEVRYDSEQQRIIHEPVSIENREVVPRVIREEDYGRR